MADYTVLASSEKVVSEVSLPAGEELTAGQSISVNASNAADFNALVDSTVPAGKKITSICLQLICKVENA